MQDNTFRYSTGTAIDVTGDVRVNGNSVCLEDGTNCLSTSGNEVWSYSIASDLIHPVTSTSDFAVGGTTQDTAPVYYDVNSTNTRILFGGNGSSTDVLIGGSTSTISNSLFQLTGDDLYVAGNIGSASSVYTNGAFVAGNASTYYGDGSIAHIGDSFTVKNDDSQIELYDNGSFITYAIRLNDTLRYELTASGFTYYEADGSQSLTVANGTTYVKQADGEDRIRVEDSTGNTYLYSSGSTVISELGGDERFRITSDGDTTLRDGGGTTRLTLNSNGIQVSGGLFSSNNDQIDIGSSTASFRNAYASGTAYIGTDVVVNGQSVCLSDGTNCGPATEADTLASVTNRGSVATSSVTFYGGVTTSDLTATGTTDLQGLTFTVATGTSATTTNFFATNLLFTGATGTNVNATNIVSTNGNISDLVVGSSANIVDLTVTGVSDLQNVTFNGATGSNLALTGGLTVSGSFSAGSSTLSTLDFTYATGTAIDVTEDVRVNGLSVCLSDGTNCAATSTTSNLQEVTDNGNTTTNAIQFAGGTSTSNFVIGSSDNSGTLNSLFQLDGNDLYVDGNIGSASSVYTNGAFVAGSNSTWYGSGFITNTTGTLQITSVSGTRVTERMDAYELNRWFAHPERSTSFNVNLNSITGLSGPQGALFDGVYMWVSNLSAGTVHKYTLKNELVDTISVGSSPLGMAFDGEHIWVADPGSSQVHKINVYTHDVVSSVGVGSAPLSAVYDGEYIWVGNYGVGTLSKINPVTEAVTTVSGLAGPEDLAFDGEYIWVADSGNDSVRKVDPATDSVVETIAVGDNPHGVVFDGGYLWVTNYHSNSVSKIDVLTDTVIATTTVGQWPYKITFDGRYIWVPNSGADTVSQIDVFTNAVVKTHDTCDNPIAIEFDGSAVWVPCNTDNEVRKYSSNGSHGAAFTMQDNTFRYSTGTAIDVTGDVRVNGNSVCLADGTNCTATSTSSNLQEVTDNGNVTTNDIQFAGGTSTQNLYVEGRLNLDDGTSGLPAITFSDDQDTGLFSTNNGVLNFTINGTNQYALDGSSIRPVNTDSYDLGSSDNSWRDLYASGTGIFGDNLYVGTSTYGSGMHSAFAVDGDDLYVAGNIGSASSVYTNGAFVAGSGSTFFGSGFINDTDGDLELSASGDVLVDGLTATTTGLKIGGDRNIRSASDATTYFSFGSGSTISNFIAGTQRKLINGTQMLEYSPDQATYTQLSNVGHSFYADSALRLSLNDGSFIGLYSATGSNVMRINDNDITAYKPFLPSADNAWDLGSSSNAWKDVYATGTLHVGNGGEIRGYLDVIRGASVLGNTLSISVGGN
ncbi:hypothetical protein GF380_00625, partial [Candidatus Uhrbacteria bacterium]|nr:hypothetical protein [Candidatus Uhrbacteria bacterium]